MTEAVLWNRSPKSFLSLKIYQKCALHQNKYFLGNTVGLQQPGSKPSPPPGPAQAAAVPPGERPGAAVPRSLRERGREPPPSGDGRGGAAGGSAGPCPGLRVKFPPAVQEFMGFLTSALS